MELPLFPLNVVLFPGMVLPLHIFEHRYREMIARCIDEKLPFGVVLVEKGQEVGEGAATPHLIGTVARIVRVERLDDGRMNITAVGTERFRVKQLHHTHSYVTGTVEHYPVVNGGTKLAEELAHKIRPRILEYVELLAKSSNSQLQLDRLPEDPLTLAFLVGIALQVDNEHKQKLLALPGIPEMLAREQYILSREVLLLRHMINTHAEVEEMTSGPTGYVFPN
ncbi:MAG: LON peptidase substrate-binding domain-containing protein [Chloroflexi bacterium]|nr:LON peptidase substrate-binding domain-containing protein [Chloroflexota bacterium]